MWKENDNFSNRSVPVSQRQQKPVYNINKQQCKKVQISRSAGVLGL